MRSRQDPCTLKTVTKLKIKIIALGKIKEKYIKQGIDEFSKRLVPHVPFEICEVNPVEIKDKNLKNKILLQEGERILSEIKPTDYVVTLEINGRQFTSEEFASKINEIINSGTSELVFVIGSSCGLGENISNRANLKMSMSKMTFLHEFARLILVEQIYRAFKILKGERYHK